MRSNKRFQERRFKKSNYTVILWFSIAFFLALALLLILQSVDALDFTQVKNADYTGSILTLSGVLLAVKTLVVGLEKSFIIPAKNSNDGQKSPSYSDTDYLETLHIISKSVYFTITVGILSLLKRILKISAPFDVWIGITITSFVVGVFVLTFLASFKFSRLINRKYY